MREARAKSQAYNLFGRLFIDGLNPTTLGWVKFLPDLYSQVPEEKDPDLWASSFQRIFGSEVTPYGSVFCSSGGKLGGAVASRVISAFQESGFNKAKLRVEPDHIGAELLNLGFICAALSESLADGQNVAAAALVQLKDKFLRQHVLRWLPALAVAVGERGAPFYQRLVDLSLELVLSEEATGVDTDLDLGLPQPTLDLSETSTDWRAISRHFLTPAFSGFYLSRGQIVELSAAVGVPSGFGPRENMLQTLFLGSADRTQLAGLLTKFDALLLSSQQSFESKRALGAPVDLWLSRLGDSRATVSTLSAAVAAS